MIRHDCPVRNPRITAGVYMDVPLPVLILILCTAASSAELPVRHVVLYKNGVGYFERAGEVKAGDHAQLAFRQSEMNDILKSLTVRDASGNVITSLRYDSAEPLGARLSTFPFDPGEETPSLSGMLNRLRGARVTATTGAESFTGAIVLARQIAATDRQPEREQIVLLLDSGEMRTVESVTITGLRFADPSLQERFREYLRTFAQSISADKRMLTIESSKDSTRSLRASYMVPAPIWKSSYRLIVNDAGEPVLEGWAIVDNTSGEDWNGVRLALVSGRPVSFISNLFETRNIQRQVMDLPELAAVSPVLYEGAVARGVVGGFPGGTPGGVIGGIIGSVPSAAPPPPPPPRAAAKAEYSSINVQNTAAREIADLFEYSFAQPVTIRAGESAMLPFVQQKIGGRKLLIYSDHSARHPMSAIELKNTTGKTLDGGPITVFESASYAGESLMATLKAGDDRLIGYAVDIGTRIGTKLDSGSQDIREIHLRRGLLTVRTAQRFTRTYSIRNVDKRAKTLMIEHPIRSNFKLVDAQPTETTATAYRFEVSLAPDAEQTFPVVEEHVQESSLAITSLSPSVLATYIQGRSLSETGRKALEQIATLKRRIEELGVQAGEVEAEVKTLEADNERTRQNIRSLNDVAGQSEQVQRYARQLGEFEARLAGLRDRQADLTRQRVQLQAQLNTVIESTTF